MAFYRWSPHLPQSFRISYEAQCSRFRRLALQECNPNMSALYSAWGLDVLSVLFRENILLPRVAHGDLEGATWKSTAQLQVAKLAQECRIGSGPKTGACLHPSSGQAAHRPTCSSPLPPCFISGHPPQVPVQASQGWPYLWDSQPLTQKRVN